MYSFDVFIYSSIDSFIYRLFLFYFSIRFFVHVFVSPFICLFIYLMAAIGVNPTQRWRQPGFGYAPFGGSLKPWGHRPCGALMIMATESMDVELAWESSVATFTQHQGEARIPWAVAVPQID